MANHSLSGQADDFTARVINKVESWLGDKLNLQLVSYDYKLPRL